MEVYSMLKEKFGFERFRPGQEAVIRDVLAGKDTIAIMPTGMGEITLLPIASLSVEGIHSHSLTSYRPHGRSSGKYETER